MKTMPHINPNPVSVLSSCLFSRKAVPYWLIFGLALAVRIVHQILISQNDPMYGFLLPGGDNHTYDRWASEISQAFLLGWERIPFFHGPLYPYLLSLIYLRFGHEHDPAAWAQRILGALTVVCIFYLARRIFGKKAGWFAGIGAAGCPLSLFYEGEILVETVIMFLHAVSLCLFLEAANRKTQRWWAFCGVALGFCCIGRPNVLLFVPVAAIWIAIVAPQAWRKRLLSVCIFLAAAGMVIAPVTALNYFVGHRFFLVTYSGAYNLYIGNAPEAIGVFFTPPAMKAIREAEQKPDIEINWRRYLFEEIKKDPWLLPRKLALKTKLFLQSGELPCDVNFYIRKPYSPLYSLPFRWAVVAPLGLVGLVLALADKKNIGIVSPHCLLSAYLLLYSASVILVFVPGRLRMPALAVLFVFAGYALSFVVEASVSFLKTRKVRPSLFMALAVLLCWPVLGCVMRSPSDKLLVRWNDYFNLGSAYELDGRFNEALDAYEKARERAPELNMLEDVCDELRQRIAKNANLYRTTNKK